MNVKMKIVSRKSPRTKMRQRVQRAPEQGLARHSSPKRPEGLKSRMATSTARP